MGVRLGKVDHLDLVSGDHGVRICRIGDLAAEGNDFVREQLALLVDFQELSRSHPVIGAQAVDERQVFLTRSSSLGVGKRGPHVEEPRFAIVESPEPLVSSEAG